MEHLLRADGEVGGGPICGGHGDNKLDARRSNEHPALGFLLIMEKRKKLMSKNQTQSDVSMVECVFCCINRTRSICRNGAQKSLRFHTLFLNGEKMCLVGVRVSAEVAAAVGIRVLEYSTTRSLAPWQKMRTPSCSPNSCGCPHSGEQGGHLGIFEHNNLVLLPDISSRNGPNSQAEMHFFVVSHTPPELLIEVANFVEKQEHQTANLQG